MAAHPKSGGRHPLRSPPWRWVIPPGAPGPATASRPALQVILDDLVTGPERAAPGATACVLGPQGQWVGSAGLANVKTGEAMRPDARMRIQSNSKTWLAAVAFQFANEGRLALADTVEDWVPGLLPYGDELTVRQLMSDTSGLVDDNDLGSSPAAFAQALANVDDAELTAQLTALFERVEATNAWRRCSSSKTPTDELQRRPHHRISCWRTVR